MSFAENLRQVRKEKRLSQEELAEIMDVSRQAVSKWEQGEGYPEVEKLLRLSSKLNISLDSLMSAEIANDNLLTDGSITGNIVIKSPNENAVVSCYKVVSSQKFKGGNKSPQYALFGISSGRYSFWGEPTTFLGWYANQELISKEISEIHQAIIQGIKDYELKYSSKVERKWLKVHIVDE